MNTERRGRKGFAEGAEKTFLWFSFRVLCVIFASSAFGCFMNQIGL